MNNYVYAKLGTACHDNLSVLTSNTKFFPLTQSDYNMQYTNMYRYPGQTYDLSRDIEIDKRPEEIKTNNDTPYKEVDEYYTSSCCGKK